MARRSATAEGVETVTEASEEPAAGGAETALDPVAGEILRQIGARGPGKSVCPTEVARAIAAARARPSDPPDAWRRYLTAVRQQALNLARQGRIVILRKGKAQDPNKPVKGVIRLAAPGPDW